MTIRNWTERDFVNCAAVKAHRERARDQWLWVGYCWFWLVGPGATGKVRGEPHDDHERRVAERERVRHGWEITSVISAYSWAKTQQALPPLRPDGKFELGACPPTVERDWPEVYLKAEHSPELKRLLERIGAWKDAPKEGHEEGRPMPRREEAGPKVETLIPAGAGYVEGAVEGESEEDPFAEPGASW